MHLLLRLSAAFLTLLLCTMTTFADPPTSSHSTENVIFVMTDGLRWQEVFNGAEEALLNRGRGGPKEWDIQKKIYWRDTADARRKVLMPFFWSVLAKQGQVYGNRQKGSDASVTNGYNFSYPGYSETLCGFPDPRLDSNNNRPNPNVTVLEWLSKKPKFKGCVAAFGAWDTFKGIFNASRCGFLVNTCYDPLKSIPMTPSLEMVNRLKTEIPHKREDECFDALPFYTALEYLKAKNPRVLFLSFSETDDWAHDGNYKKYLESAHRVDSYLKQFWETIQTMPQYRGKTTLIFCPDHGRGDAPFEWRSHGVAIKGSQYTWMAFLGPHTPALGERANIAPVTQNQIAATLARFLGENYNAAVPQAGKPIQDALLTNRR